MSAKEKSKLTYETDVPHKGQRLKELIIYISDKCSANEKFCDTMLNKILWASDFLSFQLRGKPITGEKYQRLEHGPAPYRMMPIRQEMQTQDDIIIRKASYHNRMQTRVIPTRDADLSLFNGEEIAIVDEIIDSLSRFNATEISNWSHMRAWKTHNNGDFIPYEAVYLSDEEPTAGDIARTEELGRKLGWDVYRKKAA